MKISEEAKQVFSEKVHFIGERDFGTWENGKINDRARKFVELYIDKFSAEGFQELKVDVSAMNKEGSQTEYEIKILFVTDQDSYHTQKTGWNAYNTFREALEAIENQVFNKKEN